MQAKAFSRVSRALTLLTSALFLAGCFGEGDGPEPIENTAASPLPDLPDDFCDATNFEIFCEPPEIINFNGGATTIIENPDKSGINDSDFVAQMQKFQDEVFGGTKLTFDAPIDFSQGESYNIKVWSPREVEVLFKTDESNIERFFTHPGGSEWQQFCVTFAGAAAGIDNPSLTIIFDLGTQGAAASDPANWTFFYDDIEQVESCDVGGGGGGGGGPTDFATLTFDDAGTTYTLRGFGGAEDSSVVADPEDAANNVLRINRAGDAQTFAGTVVSTGANESSGVIPLDASNTIMSMRVWSPMAGVPIRLKIEDSTNDEISVETEATTTAAMSWETLQFDFSVEAAGTAAFNPASTYDKVIVFPNFGATGADAGAQTYYFDDIAVGAGGGGTGGGGGGGFDSGLLTNGDFEAGVSPWLAGVTDPIPASSIIDDGGSSVYFANVTSPNPNEPFQVNLSQKLTITPDETYTLTFKARSNGDRSIIAGIGLSDGDFSNTTQTVDLTATYQTFTVELTATGFGDANSRVLFDLNGEAGEVYIDDVSLVVAAPFDSGLLTNGDFEAGVSPWLAGVTDPIPASSIIDDGGSSVYFANVTSPNPNEPFQVNLSQKLTITPDETYTLTFKARSNGDRSIIAGIGLSDGDFSNTTQTVDLTATYQTFTVELTATGFGDANSRVLFDLNGEAGEVYIDDVSLVVFTPPSFDSGLLTNGDFESGVSPWLAGVTNPIADTNIVDDMGSNAYFANVTSPNPNEPFQVNLSQKLTITPDETYTLTFKARSNGDRSIIAGIGLSDGDFSNTTQTVDLTATYQTFTVELTATGFGDANSRVLFDLNGEAGEVYIDDVSLVVAGSGGGGGGPSANVDFESGSPMFNNFDGGMSAAVPNPDVSGLNTSATVIEMQKMPGQPFGGSTYDLGGSAPLADGDSYTMLVRSPRPVRVTFKLEGINMERAVWHSGSGTWEELCYDFTGVSGDVTGYTVIFDNGIVGAADTEPANWTFEYDDILQTSSACPAIPAHDSGLLTNGDFESGVSPWLAGVTNPIADTNIADVGGNSTYFVDVTSPNPNEPFQVNLSQKLTITPDTAYTLTFRARASVARTAIAGIGLSDGDFSNTTQTVNLNTGWQDFSLELTSTGFGDANSRVLFDLNAEAGQVYIDEVALVEVPPFDSGLLTNGDFESGTSPWLAGVTNPIADTNIVEDMGSNVYFVDVTSPNPNEPFQVNLSQKLTITPNETYTLTFKARSNGDRSIIAGIGLSDGDFANTNQAVDLTASYQTFTLDLTATNFGDANSRVLFDLNGEAGEVYIDDVSLVVATGGGGGGGGGGAGEIAVDGGFEAQGAAGMLSDPWFAFAEGGVVSVSNVNANGGTYSVRLQADASSGSPSFPQVKIERVGSGSVTGGESVTVTFDVIDVDTAGVGKTFVAELFSERADPPGGATNEVIVGGYDLTGTWTTRSITTALGADASQGVSLLFKADCGANTACTMDVFIDNVSIVIN